MKTRLVDTLQPPYYAVIFSNRRTPGDHGYGDMAERMMERASEQPGFLGAESVRDADGVGITVSYWKDLDAVAAWRQDTEHREAQRRGREEWYAAFRLRVCRVEREHGMGPG